MPQTTFGHTSGSPTRTLAGGPLFALTLLAGVLFAAGCGGSTAAAPPDCTNMTDTWSSYASGFFADNCSSCHSFAGSKSAVESQSQSIADRISSGDMPPSGGLSDAERQRIVNWLGCGMP